LETTTKTLLPELYRVVDANINRLKEGIRVIEDIARYSYDNQELASALKTLRHQTPVDNRERLLAARDSTRDVLRQSRASEMYRADIDSIIIANFKRAQESARVLEEIYKLTSLELSEKFKTMRYELYKLEKDSNIAL